MNNKLIIKSSFAHNLPIFRSQSVLSASADSKLLDLQNRIILSLIQITENFSLGHVINSWTSDNSNPLCSICIGEAWRGNCQYTAIGFKANVFVKGGKEFRQCSLRLLLWEWNTVFVLFHFICVCVVSSSYYYYFLVFLCSLKALTRKLGSQLR